MLCAQFSKGKLSSTYFSGILLAGTAGSELESLEILHWNFFQMLVLARFRFRRKGFLEICFIACWHIWKQRNTKIFQNIDPAFDGWWCAFQNEVLLHMCRMNEDRDRKFLIGYYNIFDCIGGF